MNRKYTPLIAIAGVLALLIIGGVALYRTLGDLMPGRQLRVVATPTPAQTPPDGTSGRPETSDPATTTPASDTPATPTTPPTESPDPSDTDAAAPTSPPDPSDTADPEVPEPQILDFTVYDADRTPVRFTDYVGKPVVLNFWASWCPPCRVEMPYFQEMYEELGDDVHFLMVNQTDGDRETQALAEAFVAEDGYTFPILYDHDFDAAATYGIRALPSTFFIGPDGIVVAYAYGGISKEQLQEGIGYITAAE